MKLVIVYLLPIRIIMSFIYPRNRFAPGKLTSTFFGAYIPRHHVLDWYYLGLHLLRFVCTITKRAEKVKSFWILFTMLSHQVLWHRVIIKCLRIAVYV